MKDLLLHIDQPFFAPLDFLIGVAIAFVVLAMVARSFPNIPEPPLRFRTPAGNFPFFDGVVLYGLMLVLVGFLFKLVGTFL